MENKNWFQTTNQIRDLPSAKHTKNYGKDPPLIAG